MDRTIIAMHLRQFIDYLKVIDKVEIHKDDEEVYHLKNFYIFDTKTHKIVDKQNGWTINFMSSAGQYFMELESYCKKCLETKDYEISKSLLSIVEEHLEKLAEGAMKLEFLDKISESLREKNEIFKTVLGVISGNYKGKFSTIINKVENEVHSYETKNDVDLTEAYTVIRQFKSIIQNM